MKIKYILLLFFVNTAFLNAQYYCYDDSACNTGEQCFNCEGDNCCCNYGSNGGSDGGGDDIIDDGDGGDWELSGAQDFGMTAALLQVDYESHDDVSYKQEAKNWEGLKLDSLDKIAELLH